MQKLNKSYIGLRPDLIKFIKSESNVVLDVGCAIGSNGAYLLENNLAAQVYGVEFDEKMSKTASNYLTKVFTGDLNDSDFVSSILNDKREYDYILFGDILEHLINPNEVLLQFKKVLKPKGKIIISLPNIAHLELFIQVFIKGTWPRNNRGIFDKTHLRWFTKKDLYNLISNTGFEVVKYERKYRSRDAINSKMTFFYKIIKLFKKDLVTFQHLVICKHA